jgi:ribosomal protein L16 Arg81 hydroxylase
MQVKADFAGDIQRVSHQNFREEGLAGIGIADLMKEAGLTVGGFYKHFKSRDALVIGQSTDRRPWQVLVSVVVPSWN